MAASTSTTPLQARNPGALQFSQQPSTMDARETWTPATTFEEKVKSIVEFIDEGDCLVFMNEKSIPPAGNRLYHKCTSELCEKFDTKTNEIYILEDEPGNKLFDKDTYDKLQDELEQIGLRCKMPSAQTISVAIDSYSTRIRAKTVYSNFRNLVTNF